MGKFSTQEKFSPQNEILNSSKNSPLHAKFSTEKKILNSAENSQVRRKF